MLLQLQLSLQLQISVLLHMSMLLQLQLANEVALVNVANINNAAVALINAAAVVNIRNAAVFNDDGVANVAAIISLFALFNDSPKQSPQLFMLHLSMLLQLQICIVAFVNIAAVADANDVALVNVECSVTLNELAKKARKIYCNFEFHEEVIMLQLNMMLQTHILLQLHVLLHLKCCCSCRCQCCCSILLVLLHLSILLQLH